MLLWSWCMINPPSGLGQKVQTIDRHSVSWNRYYLMWTFQPEWTFHQEIDYRFFLETGAWHQLALHTHVHYRTSSEIELALGISRMENGDATPSQRNSPHQVEWRTFQEFHFPTPLPTPFSLSHRYRIEQRYVKNSAAPFVWRGRYRLQFNWTLPNSRWIIHASNEAFINWGRNISSVFDQNRTYVGLSYVFSWKLRLEAGYLMQWQQAGRPNLLYLRNVGRISVYHRL